MSAFDAEYEPSPWGPIAEEVERYERTDGAEASELVGDQWVVLWTIGGRSGKVRKTPLVRVTDGAGRYAVVGSMGGAPTHPQWVHNVRAAASATKVWPSYDDYQTATERRIPLFVLTPSD